MAIRLGDIAPDFVQQSTEGDISFHDYLGDSWAVLFSHPRNFTPVCSTELGQVANLQAEFAQRNVKTIGLSVDELENHGAWSDDIQATQGQALNFPLLADADRTVSTLYDMIHPEADGTATVRSVFIIDPAKKVRLILTYPAATGRNFNEILRVIDSIQLTDSNKVATPANWQQGEDVIISPSISNEAAAEIYPDGWDEQLPYLRFVKQPK